MSRWGKEAHMAIVESLCRHRLDVSVKATFRDINHGMNVLTCMHLL